MAKLELQNVKKSYGKLDVIPGISLDIKSGEFVVLVGPSGSGKSTLLRMIAGLEETTGGKIIVDDEDITGQDPALRDLAMVFQTYALYPHMTVEQNMGFALKMRGMDPEEIAHRVADSVEMLGLKGLEKRKPGQLSGGQRQRVAMGRCVVRNPKLFLFDEPLSNLDAKLRAQTRLEVRRLHDRLKATSIFVTHDQVEAMTMADRIALLKDGHLQQIGTPQELYLTPHNVFVATFLGTPEMNIFEGDLAIGDDGLRFSGTPSMALPASAERLAAVRAAGHGSTSVQLGIRPEHLVIVEASRKDAVRMEVIAVEWLGHEVFIFGDCAGKQVAVRAPETDGSIDATALPKNGDVIGLVPQTDRWHLFDGVTGNNLLT
ncbi:ABC transporter ATP-binding protein [Martelella endophytica]|uniref:Glycerol-3-phosphate transporter ATP-binding subunit n=1 Tax=Martelella endophytica TaxID=1486262 RepID=A0A0D5LKU3_MAREN|nr:sn-glycerol-3-phosphate ABC transporter ATP-binding protein UgpC [Martelella endophytica]AJY44829.1 glycerol-3-phosphate transporter ATP-binding subunit [Martelella endophytica]